MQLFRDINKALNDYSQCNAFLIQNKFYTYIEFAKVISNIRNAIAANTSSAEKNIGLIANDDIETYATIIALWLEGKAYVPISPDMPVERCENIIQQAFLKTIVDSSGNPMFAKYNVIESAKLPSAPLSLIPGEFDDQDLAYILFTSGTTGQPKGVPISRANLEGFIKAFDQLGLTINAEDRILQMFELTFDLSIMSYLVPILKGACTYTIPKDAIKYSYIYELMEEQKLTVALMVPSMLQYLRSFFDEIHLPDMKYSLFCGEALPLDITAEWQKCLPNATILNVYGPTEDTIFCTHYTFSKNNNKSNNGLVSIGKAMEGTLTIVIDEDNNLLTNGKAGQLCLGGIQLTPGYWNNMEKNKEAFFIANYEGIPERFYKTGDICKIDAEGDILYLGRSDFQVKIQGFRVELSEIEFHVKTFLKKNNAVAVAYPDKSGTTEIGLVIEASEFDITALNNYLKAKLPLYMIPRKVAFTDIFPLNSNGKTDRNKLGSFFKNVQV